MSVQPSRTVKRLLLILTVAVLYAWLMYDSPLLDYLDVWNRQYYIYFYYVYGWILDYAVMIGLLLTTFQLVVYPNLSETNRFFRALHHKTDTICPHGYMDSDICPSCSPQGENTLIR